MMPARAADTAPEVSSMAEPRLRPSAWAEINLGAIQRNFARFASQFSERTGVILSAKKQAYGHGLLEVARAVQNEPRLSGFGLWCAEEGRALRRAGIEKPILIFSIQRADELAAAIEARLTLTISDLDDARAASETASARGAVAEAHLKIDTGLGRLGQTPADALRLLPAIPHLKNLKITGVYSHLSDGWTDPAWARRQLADLETFVRQAALGDVQIHIGGSDALTLADVFQTGAIRAGLAIYGYHPAITDLDPAMTLKSRICYRRRAAAGTRISYGGTHTLARDSELALVSIGYGNGYPLSLSNRGQGLIRGRRCPVLGRVCMDQIVVDLTDSPDAQQIRIGEEVVLFGRQGEARLGADELATLAGSSPYELLCHLGQMNPRIYL